MGPTPTPRVVDRPRSADEIAARLQRLVDPDGTAADRPLQTALLRIAARHGEILTACLNAAPALHLAAFNGFLAHRGRPAVAAEAVLVFRAAPGSAPVVVPMHTQVAAPPQGSDPAPIVFETCEDLELVRAEPVAACVVDAGHLRRADVAALLAPAGRDAAVDPLAAAAPVPRAWHVAHREAFGLAGLREARLHWQLDPGSASGEGPALEFGITTPDGGFQPLAPRSETTGQLARDGELVFDAPAAWPLARVGGVESRWLSVRPRTPDERPVPRVRAVALQVVAATGPEAPVCACVDQTPLDTSKDFFPLGERPRFGDVFALRSPAFDVPGAHVELVVRMTNPQGATASPVAPVSRDGKPVIAWEISTAAGFRALAAADGTRSLTADGTLTFTVPPDVAATTIAGQTGAWLRGRLVAGDFGHLPVTASAPVAVPRAPAIRTLSVASTLTRGPLAPECVVHEGALTHVVQPGAAGDLFVAPDVDGRVLYLGFAAPAEAFCAGRTLRLQVRMPPASLPRVGNAPSPRWQQRAAGGWRDAPVLDDTTAGLTRSGIVQLRLPAAAAPWPGSALDPGAQHRWLRIVWPAGAEAPGALPVGVALNAVAAVQSQRLRDEALGASTGRAGQSFEALRAPIVGTVRLQVRETDRDWVDWRAVDDFSASRADSRHFTLDRRDGRIAFGDGRHGRIPPAGPNNLRLHAYAVGGGSRGNCPAGSITLLRTALPAVDAVTNPEPSTGGLDAETEAEMQAHASAWLRHRDRAIGADDHAELALTASPEVARAWCVAGRDLGAAGSARPADGEPGVVSVIVLPRSTDPRPQPDAALLAQVADHLCARRAPVGRLVVVGPTYAAVAVRLRVTPQPDASAHAVATEIAARVARFLHPLAGGADGRGWGLGARPHRSDIVALAAGVDGVDVVRSVTLQVDAGGAGPTVAAAGDIDVAVAE